MVRQIGDGTQRVGELEFVHRSIEIVERVGKDEIAVRFAVHEKAGQAGRTQVSQKVVLSHRAGRQVEVLEIVRQRVHVYGSDVAEAFVDIPGV